MAELSPSGGEKGRAEVCPLYLPKGMGWMVVS